MNPPADETIAAVLVEFGSRGDLSDATITEMKDAPRLCVQYYPGRPLLISIGGFDDDPRELWDIPEVADYVRRFAMASGLHDWRTRTFDALDEQCKGLLVMCGAVDPGHPYSFIPS